MRYVYTMSGCKLELHTLPHTYPLTLYNIRMILLLRIMLFYWKVDNDTFAHNVKYICEMLEQNISRTAYNYLIPMWLFQGQNCGNSLLWILFLRSDEEKKNLCWCLCKFMLKNSPGTWKGALMNGIKWGTSLKNVMYTIF